MLGVGVDLGGGWSFNGCAAPRSVRRLCGYRPLTLQRRETLRVRTGLPGLRGDPKWLPGRDHAVQCRSSNVRGVTDESVGVVVLWRVVARR